MQGNKPGLLTGCTQSFPGYPGMDMLLSGLQCSIWAAIKGGHMRGMHALGSPASGKQACTGSTSAANVFGL